MSDQEQRDGEGVCGPLHFAWVVEQGPTRAVNEDAVVACPVPWWDGSTALVAAVADGLGGEGNGGEASAVAVAGIETLAASWAAAGPPPDWDAVHKALVETFNGIDQRIRATAFAAGHRPGATTLVAAIIAPDGFIHAYTGDSRLYHLSQGELYRTRDQSLAQIYLETGRIKSEAEATRRQRNTLFSTLGGEEGQLSIEPEWVWDSTNADPVSSPLATQPAFRTLSAGDTVLLCTDGLWGVVAQEEITDPVGGGAEPVTLRDRWLKAALEGGGPDNIGMVVVGVRVGQ